MKVFLILAFLQIACNHTSNFITKDYQNVKLTADHFVISISDLNILNKKDIKNSFGGDNPDSCFINFFCFSPFFDYLWLNCFSLRKFCM